MESRYWKQWKKPTHLRKNCLKSMSTITTIIKKVKNVATTIMKTVKNVAITMTESSTIIMKRVKNVAATMTVSTTIIMKKVKDVAATMTGNNIMNMDTITIMQMRYLQAGVLKQHINLQRMNLKILLTNFLLATHMVRCSVPKE